MLCYSNGTDKNLRTQFFRETHYYYFMPRPKRNARLTLSKLNAAQGRSDIIGRRQRVRPKVMCFNSLDK